MSVSLRFRNDCFVWVRSDLLAHEYQHRSLTALAIIGAISSHTLLLKISAFSSGYGTGVVLPSSLYRVQPSITFHVFGIDGMSLYTNDSTKCRYGCDCSLAIIWKCSTKFVPRNGGNFTLTSANLSDSPISMPCERNSFWHLLRSKFQIKRNLHWNCEIVLPIDSIRFDGFWKSISKHLLVHWRRQHLNSHFVPSAIISHFFFRYAAVSFNGRPFDCAIHFGRLFSAGVLYPFFSLFAVNLCLCSHVAKTAILRDSQCDQSHFHEKNSLTSPDEKLYYSRFLANVVLAFSTIIVSHTIFTTSANTAKLCCKQLRIQQLRFHLATLIPFSNSSYQYWNLMMQPLLLLLPVVISNIAQSHAKYVNCDRWFMGYVLKLSSSNSKPFKVKWKPLKIIRWLIMSFYYIIFIFIVWMYANVLYNL